MDISSVKAYSSTPAPKAQRTEEARPAQRQEPAREAQAARAPESQPKPVVNSQGQTTGRLVNTKA